MERPEIKDGMFGLAIADAVGVPAEFKSREMMKRHPITDMVGYGTHNQPEGTWSDDSSMAIATMDSINECNEINYADIMGKFAEWECNSKYTATGVFFDIGITTSTAIDRYLKGTPPLQCGEQSVRSNGNGSLMRILPVVLYCRYKSLSREEAIEIVSNVSALTHAHEISKLGCVIYQDYINELLDGKDKKTAYENLGDYDYSPYFSKESIDYYKRVLDGGLENLPERDIRSSGFVVDTLEASIWSNLNTNNYRDSVLQAINLGEDTDTVGAVTGSIAGILYGYESMPKYWRENLKSKEYLEDLCNKFDITMANRLTK